MVSETNKISLELLELYFIVACENQLLDAETATIEEPEADVGFLLFIVIYRQRIIE